MKALISHEYGVIYPYLYSEIERADCNIFVVLDTLVRGRSTGWDNIPTVMCVCTSFFILTRSCIVLNSGCQAIAVVAPLLQRSTVVAVAVAVTISGGATRSQSGEERRRPRH